MRGVWLGQAGFLLTADDGMTIMIDPYLSDSLKNANGEDFQREVPIDPAYLQTPDILVLSHCHEDHMDLDTLDQLFGDKRMTVLAPANVLPVLRERYPGKAEFVLFTPGTELTLGNILFRAVFAAHSDREAIGIIVECDGQRVYHMGDTLYHREILRSDIGKLDLLILPINGKGNNMNHIDAARMTRELAPKAVLPMHWDMFRKFGADVSAFVDLFRENEQTVFIPKHYEQFDI